MNWQAPSSVRCSATVPPSIRQNPSSSIDVGGATNRKNDLLLDGAPIQLNQKGSYESDAVSDKKALATARKASGTAVERLIGDAIASGGKVKGFKPHVQAFVGYIVSHESHHRGQEHHRGELERNQVVLEQRQRDGLHRALPLDHVGDGAVGQ